VGTKILGAAREGHVASHVLSLSEDLTSRLGTSD